MKNDRETPLMKQFNTIKAQYPGTLLLFRVGDFYETFGEDAIRASGILGIVLTHRANGSAAEIELAGFPYHALDSYLPRLVKAGLRVAVCEQLEDPKATKGIVKRGVTELVTPGLVMNDKVLDSRSNHYLCSLWWEREDWIGLAFLDLSTGEFGCKAGSPESIEKLLHQLSPAEVITSRKDVKEYRARWGERFYHFRLEDWAFHPDTALARLLQHFNTHSLKGFGLGDVQAEWVPAGAILSYLDQNEQKQISHITQLYRLADETFMGLDPFTIRNLELFKPMVPEGKTLIEVIGQTQTVMGARLLHRWMAFPLKEISPILIRQERVEAFLKEPEVGSQLFKILSTFSDLERLTAKLATQKLNPRDAYFLRNTIRKIPALSEALSAAANVPLVELGIGFKSVTTVLEWFDTWMEEEPSMQLQEGKVIRSDRSAELAEYRELESSGKQYLLDLQQKEIARTGISSLKISFNNVFGYYIEITNVHKDKVPQDYIRKQTLTNAERYITPELKVFEEKILAAESKILQLETILYQEFLAGLIPFIEDLQHNANQVAETDVLLNFANLSLKNGYVRPEIREDNRIEIEAGRHPVIETLLPREQPYIPNDVVLDGDQQQIIIITGPNMAGKSALLRQTALIVLLAQIGSFVPATQAKIGLVDQIFTRVGGSDNISAGESTFMVEMNETARILNTCTQRSLILLDEIGRGTSTYDGVSIAWSLVEYLHEQANCAARTLFATHYHELSELANRFPRVKNFNVSVKESNGKILFLRKLIPGDSAHSFGIQVAEMAGMPPSVIHRAKTILQQFESRRIDPQNQEGHLKFSPLQELQLNMFELKDEDTLIIRKILAGCDIDQMTPVEALLKLQEIKRELARINQATSNN